MKIRRPRFVDIRHQSTPRDITISLALLALLLLWDATGWDHVWIRWFGDSHGFALRDAWLTSTVLHHGGRMVAWVLMGGLVLSLWRPVGPFLAGLSLRERLSTVTAVLICLLAVPLLKYFSSTSCPWDLREFGGIAAYLSHWHWGSGDGGPGHCFPSGHAVSAFAFLPVYFALRDKQPAWAMKWLVTIGIMGALFGLAQMARGAHYPSHTLWSAWICWVLACLLQRIFNTARIPQSCSRAALE